MAGLSGQCVNPHGLRVDIIDNYHFTEWDRKIEITRGERDRLMKNAQSYEKSEEIKRIYNHRIEMFLEKKFKEFEKTTKNIDDKIQYCEIELRYLSSDGFMYSPYSFEYSLMTNFFKKRLESLIAEKNKNNEKSSSGSQPNF